jgi:hypothetical protein
MRVYAKCAKQANICPSVSHSAFLNCSLYVLLSMCLYDSEYQVYKAGNYMSIHLYVFLYLCLSDVCLCVL